MSPVLTFHPFEADRESQHQTAPADYGIPVRGWMAFARRTAATAKRIRSAGRGRSARSAFAADGDNTQWRVDKLRRGSRLRRDGADHKCAIVMRGPRRKI